MNRRELLKRLGLVAALPAVAKAETSCPIFPKEAEVSDPKPIVSRRSRRSLYHNGKKIEVEDRVGYDAASCYYYARSTYSQDGYHEYHALVRKFQLPSGLKSVNRQWLLDANDERFRHDQRWRAG